MLIAIIIPCLNEREMITKTAASLGFGPQEPPQDAFLVLVDNGSRDGTLGVLREIQRQAGPRAVVVAEEADRGYVPPRAKGIEIASQMAYTQNVPPDQLLILQADAPPDVRTFASMKPTFPRPWPLAGCGSDSDSWAGFLAAGNEPSITAWRKSQLAI